MSFEKAVEEKTRAAIIGSLYAGRTAVVKKKVFMNRLKLRYDAQPAKKIFISGKAYSIESKQIDYEGSTYIGVE
jgi:hypothetical protein